MSRLVVSGPRSLRVAVGLVFALVSGASAAPARKTAGAAVDPLDTASGLVARYLQLVLLDGKPDLPVAERQKLGAAMRAAAERHGKLPLSSPSGARYDALLALDRNFTPASLGLARVAEALLRLSMGDSALARAANGAIVWQAARALAAAARSSQPPEQVAVTLARSFVPACPAQFASLPARGPSDEDALRRALAYCTLGTPGVTPSAERSLARELTRRVMVEADSARERLTKSRLGSGVWRAEVTLLDQALARGVRVPWESSAERIDGVNLPRASRPGAAPPVLEAERVLLADGSQHVVSVPRMLVSSGILTVDDGAPERRHLGPLVTPPTERPDAAGFLLVLADQAARVATLRALSAPPAPPAPSAGLRGLWLLAVRDGRAPEVFGLSLEAAPAGAELVKLDLRGKRWLVGKKAVPWGDPDSLARVVTRPAVVLGAPADTTIAELVYTLSALPPGTVPALALGKPAATSR